MDISIVIVNWNGADLLRDCLASIAAKRGGLAVQVLVIDNDSWDGSREMVKEDFPQFQLVNSGANLGFGKANNLARELVKSDLVLFLNPDTVLLANSLTPMIEFMRQHPETGALGCKMLYPDGGVQEQGLQYFPSPWKEFLSSLFISTGTRNGMRRFLPYLDPNRSAYATKLYGGCLLARKTVLDQVGWFDERYFMYAEDVDLCRAISDQGWKLFYLSTAEIIHVAGGVSKKAPSGFSVLMKCESIAALMRKYYGASGSLAYRLGMAFSSAIRLAFLAPARFFCLAVPGKKDVSFASSFLKHRLILLWSLGLRKPVFPRRPAA
jgi:GT2 family glycosyltransferase